MKRSEQQELLTQFCNSVRNALLEHSGEWPSNWDGHELRELASAAFAMERTALMREPRSKRRAAFQNDWVTLNLY